MSKVLITGGAGFIGSNLALALLKKGHSVRVLDNLSPQIHGENSNNSPLFRSIKDKVEFIKGDITDKENVRSALEGIEIIVHYAAETGTGQSMYAIKRYSDVNVGGTALLFDIIANNKTNIKKIIVASSRAVYGEGKYKCPIHSNIYPGSRSVEAMEKKDFEVHCPICGAVCSLIPTDESSVLSPSSIYGITKLTQEQMTLVMGQSLGISSIALRYQNVFGPGQSLSNPYTGILSIFSTRMLNGNPINIFEDGLESRDFVYIDDVVKATLAAVELEKKVVGVYNVGSGVATNVLKVANVISEKLEIDIPIQITGNFRIGDIRHNLADLSAAREILGYSPSTSFENGIGKFIDWVKTEEVNQDKYEESILEMKSKGLFK